MGSREQVILKVDKLIYRTPLKQRANNSHVLETENVKLLHPHLLLLKENSIPALKENKRGKGKERSTISYTHQTIFKSWTT